ncbi:hypothetical protein BH10CYA1_BH10CYA1_00180 [soil metagenome]
MQPCCSHHILETVLQSVPFVSVAFVAIFQYFKKFDQSLLLKAFRKSKTAE